MARSVVLHATVYFLQSGEGPPFVLPGLEAWSAGIRGGADSYDDLGP
jgi:hypothetical protein